MAVDVQPTAVRTAAVAKLVFGAVVAILFAHGGSPAGGLVALPLLPIAIRGSMVRVWTDGDVLHVRNFWRRYALRRHEIPSFEVVALHRWPGNFGIRVRRAHGRALNLSAVGVERRYTWWLARRRPAAEAIGTDLDTWLQTGA